MEGAGFGEGEEDNGEVSVMMRQEDSGRSSSAMVRLLVLVLQTVGTRAQSQDGSNAVQIGFDVAGSLH